MRRLDTELDAEPLVIGEPDNCSSPKRFRAPSRLLVRFTLLACKPTENYRTSCSGAEFSDRSSWFSLVIIFGDERHGILVSLVICNTILNEPLNNWWDGPVGIGHRRVGLLPSFASLRVATQLKRRASCGGALGALRVTGACCARSGGEPSAELQGAPELSSYCN